MEGWLFLPNLRVHIYKFCNLTQLDFPVSLAHFAIFNVLTQKPTKHEIVQFERTGRVFQSYSRYLGVHHVSTDLLYPNRLLQQFMFLPEALWVVEPQAKAL